MDDETKWAYSIDGETWEGGFAREAAVAEGLELAREGDHATYLIAPMICVDVRTHNPTADQALDEASQSIRDNVWHEAEDLDVSEEAEEALEIMLAHAWAAWVEMYGVTSDAFRVDKAGVVELVTTTGAEGEPAHGG